MNETYGYPNRKRDLPVMWFYFCWGALYVAWRGLRKVVKR